MLKSVYTCCFDLSQHSLHYLSSFFPNGFSDAVPGSGFVFSGCLRLASTVLPRRSPRARGHLASAGRTLIFHWEGWSITDVHRVVAKVRHEDILSEPLHPAITRNILFSFRKRLSKTKLFSVQQLRPITKREDDSDNALHRLTWNSHIIRCTHLPTGLCPNKTCGVAVFPLKKITFHLCFLTMPLPQV